jgi:hypothetical protein
LTTRPLPFSRLDENPTTHATFSGKVFAARREQRG